MTTKQLTDEQRAEIAINLASTGSVAVARKNLQESVRVALATKHPDTDKFLEMYRIISDMTDDELNEIMHQGLQLIRFIPRSN